MKEMTGGALFEIAPAESYSSDYDTTERQGRNENDMSGKIHSVATVETDLERLYP